MTRIISTFLGSTGIILVILRIFGIYADYTSQYFLFTGILFPVVCFILLITDKQNQHKKIKNIISRYQNSGDSDIIKQKESLKTKGWSINNSPFRNRKSGLTWSGGNMHGANASRNNRKSFMK